MSLKSILWTLLLCTQSTLVSCGLPAESPPVKASIADTEWLEGLPDFLGQPVSSTLSESPVGLRFELILTEDPGRERLQEQLIDFFTRKEHPEGACVQVEALGEKTYRIQVICLN